MHAPHSKYRQIADRLAKAIAARAYGPGERLPSVRQLMAAEAISQATAMHALVELEARGLVESRHRSGFYVRAAASEPIRLPPPTQSSAAARTVDSLHLTRDILRAFRIPNIVALGAAELSDTLVPGGDLAASARHVLGKDLRSVLPAPDPCGLPELRRAIARLMGTRGVHVPADDIIVTAGETDAMVMALRAVTRPGDTVAVESPTFFGILQEIEDAGLKALEIATDPVSGIYVDALVTAADTIGFAAVILNPTFQNPFGCRMKGEVMRALAEAMAKRAIPIIEDDVYGDLSFDGRPAQALASRDDAGNTLYCSSVSKILAPGLRIGWCVPGRFATEIRAARERRPAPVSALAQATLAHYLFGRRYARHRAGLCALFAEQKQAVRELIRATFPPGTTATDPQGGFLYWIEVPPPFDAMTFYRQALERGISIAPGPIFSTSGRFANAFRLSVGCTLTPTLRRAIATLGEIAHASCSA